MTSPTTRYAILSLRPAAGFVTVRHRLNMRFAGSDLWARMWMNRNAFGPARAPWNPLVTFCCTR